MQLDAVGNVFYYLVKITRGKHIKDHIISLIGKVWVHKGILTLTLLIGMQVLSQESDWSCIFMLGYRFFYFGFWKCSDSVVFIFLLFVL